MSASELLRHYRSLGVEFSVTPAGKLHVEAPDGSLTEDGVEQLRTHRDELIAALASSPAWPPPVPRWWAAWIEADDRRRAGTMRAGLARRAAFNCRSHNGDNS